jgi:MFS family permease
VADVSLTEAAVAAAANQKSRAFDSFSMPVYRLIWGFTVLSFLCFNAWGPTQAVIAFDLTGTNNAVGSVVFGQGLAMILLNPFSGAIADRVSKRLVLMLGMASVATMLLIMGFLLLADRVTIPLLMLAAFVVGVVYAFNGPARNAFMGQLIPAERMGNAVALVQVGANFAQTAGPFLAGGLLAWQAIGAAGVCFILAALLGIVILILLRLPNPSARQDPERVSILGEVRLGFKHVSGNPRLLHTVVQFHVVAVLGVSYFILMPAFSKEVLDAGTAGVGALLGTAAASAILTSLFVASLANSSSVERLMLLSPLVLGGALICTGLAPNFPLALVSMAFVGGSVGVFQTLNNVTALRHSSPEFFGRVMALVYMAWGVQSLAGLPIGFLADEVGERTMIASLGACLCLATLVFVWWAGRISRDEAAARVATS